MSNGLNNTWFSQHTRIRNCLYLRSSRPVTGMTGCAACPHNENGWHCVKNGRLFERSEFRPFSNDGHSQRNGSFGRPPFSSSILFRRLEKEWTYEGTGNLPCILVAQKEKVNSICKQQVYRNHKESQRKPSRHSNCTERKSR